MMGRHSVMLRPDSVRRVTPPTTTMAKTRVDDNISHIPTERGDSTGNGAEDGSAVRLVEKRRECIGSRVGDFRDKGRVFQETVGRLGSRGIKGRAATR